MAAALLAGSAGGKVARDLAHGEKHAPAPQAAPAGLPPEETTGREREEADTDAVMVPRRTTYDEQYDLLGERTLNSIAESYTGSHIPVTSDAAAIRLAQTIAGEIPELTDRLTPDTIETIGRDALSAIRDVVREAPEAFPDIVKKLGNPASPARGRKH